MEKFRLRKFINKNNVLLSMEKEGRRLNKLGQVTIFIIVGILVFVGIILVFIFQNELGITPRINTNPTIFIENCAKEAINPMLDSIISTGGIYYTGTNKNEFLDIKGISYSLLCTTNLTETSCVSTHPLIVTEIENLMTTSLKSKVDSCFNQYKNKFPNLEITSGVLEFSLKLEKGFLSVKIRKPLTISDGETANSFENFDTNINSNLFDFLKLANDIVNTESSCNCNFDLSPEMKEPTNDPFSTVIPGIVNCDVDLAKISINYPSYLFYRTNLNNSGQKIYTIGINGDNYSEKFDFAVINCFQNTTKESTTKDSGICAACA